MSIRPVNRIVASKPTLEGAGVHLRRAFGFGNTSDFDPFLLLDDFRNDIPQDYLAGFPWHPHRGIETITYVLAGTVEHGDSMGNKGAIARRRCAVDDRGQRNHPPGNAQGRRGGPHARISVVGESSLVAQDDHAALSGSEGAGHPGNSGRRWHQGSHRLRKFLGQERSCGWHRRRAHLSLTSPFRRAARRLFPWKPRATLSLMSLPGKGNSATPRGRSPCPPNRWGGSILIRPRKADNRSLILFDRGDEVMVQAGEDGIRFLLVSGKPLEEPVAWYGPIVMNTQEQLRQAFTELEEGTFLKNK